MAVVQISRIQVRRGQKNQGSGLPQLASGEIGWAIDTREMYIGNGAVSEGAPAVGNTKILTEYDDILNLADSYTYKKNEAYLVTGINSSNPIARTLQERLDDIVYVSSFGAVGDGATDDTAAIQRAIDQLYLNSATKDANGATSPSRVTLFFEPGTYLISDTLYLPPFASLVGAGSEKTTIYQTTSDAVFITVNGSSEPGTPANDSSSTTLNQAREILLQGMTIETTQSGASSANPISSVVSDTYSAKGLILQSCKNSKFKDLYFKGAWTSGTIDDNADCAILINLLSGAVKSSSNTFEDCRVYGYSVAVRSDWDIDYNSWYDCDFELLGYGFMFGAGIPGLGEVAAGRSTGPIDNQIKSSIFYDIKYNAIWVNVGQRNVSENNKFTLVGTNAKVESDPLYPVVRFYTTTSSDNYSKYNKSFHDYFARTGILSNKASTKPYYPEIEGASFYDLEYENITDFGRVSGVTLFRLPSVINQSYDIDYTLVSKTYNVVRSGIMHLIVNAYDNTVELSDDFHFVGDESYLDSIELNPLLVDLDADGNNETINIAVTSTMPVDDDTEFKYTIQAKKTEYN